jgi:hypothetical protein
MKLKTFLLSAVFISLMVSCAKDEPKVNDEDLNTTAEGAIQISTGVQSFLLSTISAAADEGFYPEVPSGGEKRKRLQTESSYDYSWHGPDANGWYTRSMTGVYDYTEKIRFRDTIDYISIISYDGADGTYKNTTTTQFIKYIENQKELYKGFSKWEIYSSGYSDISSIEWKITFEDWNPESSAGTYDWYWGVSENLGGGTVPYHRFEHLVVTETSNDWLHCHATFYDEGNIEIWDFEYDTPWAPVEMPELPVID